MMETVSGRIRSNLGRNSITSNYKSHIIKLTKGLHGYYEIKHKQFITRREDETDVFKVKPMIFANAEVLFHRVC